MFIFNQHVSLFHQLARTVSQVGDTSEFSKVVSATKEVLDCNTKILCELKDSLFPVIKNIHDEMKELRRDFTIRDDRYLEVLRKISDNTAASATAALAPPAAPAQPRSELSSEERFLLESLAMPVANPLQLLQQQQAIQQQLARQTPNLMAASMGYNINPMFSAAPPSALYNPMVSLPGSPQRSLPPVPQLPTQPQPPALAIQKPVMVSSGAKAAPTNVVISVSDPIPQTAPVVTAPMTVTVPPQHRLGGLSNSPRAVATAAATPSTPQSGAMPRCPRAW